MPRRDDPDGWVAQLVEQRTENPCVGGSIPPPATTSIPPNRIKGSRRPVVFRVGFPVHAAILQPTTSPRSRPFLSLDAAAAFPLRRCRLWTSLVRYAGTLWLLLRMESVATGMPLALVTCGWQGGGLRSSAVGIGLLSGLRNRLADSLMFANGATTTRGEERPRRTMPITVSTRTGRRKSRHELLELRTRRCNPATATGSAWFGICWASPVPRLSASKTRSNTLTTPTRRCRRTVF